MSIENAIIVRSKTRLEQLIDRFNSKAQAQFYIERSGGDFQMYIEEHDTFYRSLEEVQKGISTLVKPKVIDKSFLPSFIFTANDMVIVLGQDGLVANTAKYVDNLPLVAINPDQRSYDGVLLPFDTDNYMKGVNAVLDDNYKYKMVTMAEARIGKERLLAFNDFYIGASSHVSARYRIVVGIKEETHSSSGIIVSTGAGSTGWLSSIFNMANGLANLYVDGVKLEQKMHWDDRQLMFVVREPSLSKTSQTGITAGLIEEKEKLVIESQMPSNGIVFSDGVEADFMQFNTGAIVEIGVAKEKARIVLS